MNIQTLITLFKSATLPRTEWNHIAHLRVALYYTYSTKLSDDELLIHIRFSLICYAARTNPDYECTKRYHQTKTVFWIQQMRLFITNNPGKTLDELDALLLGTELVSNTYVEKFYSPEVLDSAKARATYVAPDLKGN